MSGVQLQRRAIKGWVLVAAAMVAVLLPLSIYPAYAVQDLPQPGRELSVPRSILVYDRTNKVIGEYSPNGEFRIYERLSQMGKLGPAAALAAEDRDFYKHGPVSATSLLRAGLTDAVGRRGIQGGSTITQQLVKIQLLTSRQTLSRKAQEAYLAWAVERRYSKDEILEIYLNSIFYGHGAYGLASATKTYFGKDKEVADLTPAQAALLAGLVQAPVGYDPLVNFEGARKRELYVLNGMVAIGALSRPAADEAAKEDLQKEIHLSSAAQASPAAHAFDFVLRYLERQYGTRVLQQGGYSVYTTLDPAIQALAAKAVAGGAAQLAGKGVNNADLLAARPATGEILAWVGSADYNNAAIGGQYDVIESRRQPGSSFKPYVYEAALKDRKIATCTVLPDSPLNYGGYRPLDYDNSFMGPMPASQALLLSRNVPAVELANREGMKGVISLADDMGITSPLEPTLPTAIGASAVTMLEHLQGYQVFANQGHRVPLTLVTKVVGPGAKVLLDLHPGSQPGQSQVLTPAESYLMSEMLKNYQNQWKLGWNRQMASKSGTTGGNQVGVHPDAWMMAYNPDIVVGAWAGNTAPNGGGRPVSAFGVDVGSTIMASFLNALPRGYEDWYARPQGLVDIGGSTFLAGTEKLAATCGRPARSPGPPGKPQPAGPPAQSDGGD